MLWLCHGLEVATRLLITRMWLGPLLLPAPPLLTGCRVVMLIHVFESVGLAGALPSEIGGVG